MVLRHTSMPYPITIRRSVAIVDSPPPAKHDLCAPLLPTLTDADLAEDCKAVCQQYLVSSACRSNSNSTSSPPIDDGDVAISSSLCNDDNASTWSDIGEEIAELFPTPNSDDDRSLAMAMAPNQDIFNQWDALYEREKHNVYAISDPHAVPEVQREKLCNWSYAIVDKYEICRDTVSIAMAYFDRLVSNGWVERSEWSLASVTCLYLAVKINSSAGRMFGPSLMAHECVYFSASEIIDMEDHICQVFDWYMNPPVPSQFVDIIAPLLMAEPMLDTSLEDGVQGIVPIHVSTREDLLRHAHYLCELSVMSSFFADREPSSVARASVMIAMEVMCFPPGAMKWFASLPLSCDEEETEECAWRFHRIWFGGGGRGGDEYVEETPSDKQPEQTSTPSSASSQPRAVTPTKSEAPPDLKRMRRDATVETLDVDSL